MISSEKKTALKAALKQMTSLFCDLTHANEEFLAGEQSEAKVAVLLETRDEAISKLSTLESHIVEAVVAIKPELAPKGTAFEIVKQLGDDLLDDETLTSFREALENLVHSDQTAAHEIEEAKTILSEEIKKLRRGNALMKGYIQSDLSGSCFVDKIK